jgi:F-type H+-transporting ATPase subunit a
MRRLLLILLLSVLPLSASEKGGSEDLGTFLMHHVTDNREVWHPLGLKAISVPLHGSFVVGGVELFPSLHIANLLLASLLLLVLLSAAARRRGTLPVSRWGHAIEAMVLFVRNDIVVPNMGNREAAKWLPFLLTLFFFILGVNLLGLFPGFASASGNLGFTVAMATMVFLLFNVMGVVHNGPISYIKGLVPHGIPFPVLVILFPIELIGLFTKSAALAIRLFANMAAGHLVIFSLLSLAAIFNSLVAAPFAIGFTLLIYLLELLVAFLQAFVFTLLTTLFISGAIHQEH